jgi:hypothetical protein
MDTGRSAARLVSSRLVSSRLVSSRLVSSRLVSSRLVSSRLVSSRPSMASDAERFLVPGFTNHHGWDNLDHVPQ